MGLLARLLLVDFSRWSTTAYPSLDPRYADAFVPFNQRWRAHPQLVAVACGGFVGTAARYLIAVQFRGPVDGLPWATLAVNLTGCLALGLLTGALEHRAASPLLRPFLATGVLGAFTTYSTFAVETNTLLVLRPATALGYLALSVGGGVLAAAAGLRLAAR